MPLEKSLELQVGRNTVKKNDLYIDIIAIFVEKVFEKVGDAFERDVTADF